jgi:hypothetical protein
MQEHRLGDLVADREHRVQARHRLLEDHADPATANLPQPGLRQGHQIQHTATGIPQQDLPRLDHARRRHKPEDRHRRDTLPASALADEPERLAPLDRQGDPIHRRHASGRRMKGSDQVIDLKQWHGGKRKKESCSRLGMKDETEGIRPVATSF